MTNTYGGYDWTPTRVRMHGTRAMVERDEVDGNASPPFLMTYAHLLPGLVGPRIETPWCITATALTLGVLRAFGIKASPVLARMLVAREGVELSAEGQAEQDATYRRYFTERVGNFDAVTYYGLPWPGHVAVITDRGWLLDAAIADVRRLHGVVMPDVILSRCPEHQSGDVFIARIQYRGGATAFTYEFYEWDESIEREPEWALGVSAVPKFLEAVERGVPVSLDHKGKLVAATRQRSRDRLLTA